MPFQVCHVLSGPKMKDAAKGEELVRELFQRMNFCGGRTKVTRNYDTMIHDDIVIISKCTGT